MFSKNRKKHKNHTEYCKHCITETVQFTMMPNYSFSLVTFFQENKSCITDLQQICQQQSAKKYTDFPRCLTY